MELPDNPLVHEVFTWVWLDELSRELGRPVDLGSVPDEAWDRIARPGVDAVWLMGVWCRSPVGAAIAREHTAMAAAQRAALSDLSDDDVVGSAYCIRDYSVDPHLGGDDGLALARRRLAERDVGLVLDFVPNHVAPDHSWTVEHPEYFVRGTLDDLAADPASFVEVEGNVLALGRDPYFPAWPEVVQLATSRSDVRREAAAVVSSIAARCDAIRCDMAMLVLDDVHVRTWGSRADPPDDEHGYWPTVFEIVRREHPDVRFWAEAYWGVEPELVGQGFDACYDKTLYDLLVDGRPAIDVRAHLGDDPRPPTVRFIENHDEPRVAATLGSAAARAATLVTLTAPGVVLLHEGQQQARRVRVPVTLGRRPVERADDDTLAWYARVLDAIGRRMRRGTWTPAGIETWPDNRSGERLLASAWSGTNTFLVVVNLSPDRADGVVRTDVLGDGPIELVDHLTGARYERDRVAVDGIYVGLDGHGAHLFERVG